MSQAVLLSEAYGEKVTGGFILISIITLWRGLQLLLSSSVCSPLSLCLPCFSALPISLLDISGSQKSCVLVEFEIRVCEGKERRDMIGGMSEPLAVILSHWKWVKQRLLFNRSSARCLTSVNIFPADFQQYPCIGLDMECTPNTGICDYSYTVFLKEAIALLNVRFELWLAR